MNCLSSTPTYMADNKPSIVKRVIDSESGVTNGPYSTNSKKEDVKPGKLPPLKQASKMPTESNTGTLPFPRSKWTAADKIKEPDRLANLQSKRREQNGRSSNSPAKAGTSNLLSSLVSRLSKAEAALKSSREKIREQERTISTLEQEISDLKEAPNEKSISDEESRAAQFWQAKCEAYLAQIEEMQAFLNRNGMLWKEESPSDALPVDFGDLCKGIEVLNLDLGKHI